MINAELAKALIASNSDAVYNRARTEACAVLDKALAEAKAVYDKALGVDFLDGSKHAENLAIQIRARADEYPEDYADDKAAFNKAYVEAWAVYYKAIDDALSAYEKNKGK